LFAFLLSLVAQQALAGTLACPGFSISLDGKNCEASYKFLTIFAGGGNSTIVKVEGKSLAEVAWVTAPVAQSAPLKAWDHLSVLSDAKIFAGDNLVREMSSLGEAASYVLPQDSAMATLNLDIVAPLRGCDVHGQNCKQEADPSAFSSGSMRLAVRAQNPESLKLSPVPTATLTVGNLKIPELPALWMASAMVPVTLGPDNRALLVFGSDEDEPASLILQVTLRDDIGELGTRIVNVPSFGGAIGFDPSDPTQGFGPKVTNGTLTVMPVTRGKMFFVSGWSIDGRGFVPLSSIKSAPLPAPPPEKE
jgi:hypothetical protein